MFFAISLVFATGVAHAQVVTPAAAPWGLDDIRAAVTAERSQVCTAGRPDLAQCLVDYARALIEIDQAIGKSGMAIQGLAQNNDYQAQQGFAQVRMQMRYFDAALQGLAKYNGGGTSAPITFLPQTFVSPQAQVVGPATQGLVATVATRCSVSEAQAQTWVLGQFAEIHGEVASSTSSSSGCP